MKKSTILSVVGIIVVIIVAGAIYSISKDGPISGPKAGEYTNSAYGLSFKYPTTYEAQDRDVGTGIQKYHTITLITKADKEKLLKGQASSQGPTSITVNIYPSNGVSLDEWVGTSKESHFAAATSGLATTTVGGAFSVVYSWNGVYRTNSAVFEHKQNIFMVSMTYTEAQDPIWKDFSTVLKSIKLD